MTSLPPLSVTHRSGSYELVIGRGLLAEVGSQLVKIGASGPSGIISNNRVNTLYGEQLRTSLQAAGFITRTILVPDGEDYKTLASAEQVLSALITQGMERSGTIITLGGGVITDLGGFVASVLYRGVRLIHIPTTLLAMVDASVGGKTGVNHVQGKNLIGSFYQPDLVLMDVNVLKSLEYRDRVSGFAEMVKMGAILDGHYFEKLFQTMPGLLDTQDDQQLAVLIRRGCELKAQIVAEDEQEADRRRILNFGHTLGHALENILGYGSIRHGEAVILGMYGAGWLSHQVGTLSDTAWRAFARYLRSIPMELTIPPLDGAAVVRLVQLDKKVADGQLYFVLLTQLGSTVLQANIPTLMIKLAVDAINKVWSQAR